MSEPDVGGQRNGEQVGVGSGGGEERRSRSPTSCPVLPLKNTVLFPYPALAAAGQHERSQQALIDARAGDAGAPADRAGGARRRRGQPGADDVYRVGTVLRIVKMLKFPDDSYRLLVQGVARARIEEFVATEPFLSARVAARSKTRATPTRSRSPRSAQRRAEFAAFVAESPKLSDELQVLAANLDDPSRLADLVASNLELDVAQKQHLLESRSTSASGCARCSRSCRARARRSRSRARSATRSRARWARRSATTCCASSSTRSARSSARAEDDGAEVDRLRERVEAAGMPEDALKQARRELERLAQTPPASAEHGVIRTYLEWMVDLPWSKQSDGPPRRRGSARAILDEDHYDLEKVKDRILEYIAVLSLKRDLQGPDPLLRGSARHRQDVARPLDRARARPRVRAHLARRRARRGRDPRPSPHLRRRAAGPHRAGPAQGRDAQPGLPARRDRQGRRRTSAAIRRRRCSRCSIRSRTRSFSDHYLEVPFDLSQVLFIATANLMDPVPPALRDRMEVIELPGYTEEDKVRDRAALPAAAPARGERRRRRRRSRCPTRRCAR